LPADTLIVRGKKEKGRKTADQNQKNWPSPQQKCSEKIKNDITKRLPWPWGLVGSKPKTCEWKQKRRGGSVKNETEPNE